MQACGMTDVGRVRSRNQDYIFCSPTCVGSLENLFVLADGMGGHRAGDYASRFAVEGLAAFARQQGGLAAQVMQDGIRRVNEELYEASLRNSDLSGMGTTLVAAVAEGGTLCVANVGDSRLYLCRNSQMLQVTRDHSYVEEMVAMGKMKRGDRDYQLKKNIITRAVGTNRRVEADFFEEELMPGDLILLCSDGLSNMLAEEEMAAVLGEASSVQRRAQRLVDQANGKGGYDNIAVIVIDPQIDEVASC